MNFNHIPYTERLSEIERVTCKHIWTTSCLIGAGYPLFNSLTNARQYMKRACKYGLVTECKIDGDGRQPINQYTLIKNQNAVVHIKLEEASLKPVTNHKVLRPADIRIQLDGVYYEQCIANMLLLSAADDRERYAEEIRSSSPIQEHAHV